LPGGWSGTSTTNSINSTSGTAGGTISVTANNACGNSTAQTLSVTVNPLPTVTVSLNTNAVCVDNAVFTLAGGLPVGGTFSGTSVTGGNFNAATAGVGSHTITYSFTDGNGCTNSNTDQLTVNNCTGIPGSVTLSEVEGLEILIYPNPFTNEITIAGNFNGQAHLEIYNSLGKSVLSTKITSNHNLQTSNLAPGIYVFCISNEQGITSRRIVKE
jgi:hypothetical protein